MGRTFKHILGFRLLVSFGHQFLLLLYSWSSAVVAVLIVHTSQHASGKIILGLHLEGPQGHIHSLSFCPSVPQAVWLAPQISPCPLIPAASVLVWGLTWSSIVKVEPATLPPTLPPGNVSFPCPPEFLAHYPIAQQILPWYNLTAFLETNAEHKYKMEC